MSIEHEYRRNLFTAKSKHVFFWQIKGHNSKTNQTYNYGSRPCASISNDLLRGSSVIEQNSIVVWTYILTWVKLV